MYEENEQRESVLLCHVQYVLLKDTRLGLLYYNYPSCTHCTLYHSGDIRTKGIHGGKSHFVHVAAACNPPACTRTLTRFTVIRPSAALPALVVRFGT